MKEFVKDLSAQTEELPIISTMLLSGNKEGEKISIELSSGGFVQIQFGFELVVVRISDEHGDLVDSAQAEYQQLSED